MKKLLVLILVLTLALGLIGCKKDKECETHVDSDLNGKCDVCEADVALPDDGKEDGKEDGDKDDPDLGLVLSNALLSQLKEAKSAKLTLEVHNIEEDIYWEENGDSDPEECKMYDEAKITLTIIVSDSSEGFAAKITSVDASRYDEADEFEEYTSCSYLLDGEMYEYIPESNILVKKDSEFDVSQLEEAILLLTDGVEIPEADKQAALKAIGDFAVTTFGIENGKGSFTFDFKPTVDDLKAYFAALDFDNDKVSKVVDDALALIDPELTSASLFAELERVAGLTVNEALAEIDAWLTTNHNTTLQGIYDTVVNNSTVVSIVENILTEQYGPDYEELEDAVAADIAEMQSFKIAEMITEMQIGDMVVYDMILSFLPQTDDEGNAVEYPTAEQAFDSIEAILALTLSEFESNMGTPVFSSVKEVLTNTTVNALNGKIELGLSSLYKLETLGVELNVDYTSNTASDVEGKLDTRSNTMNVKLTISDISASEVNIALPEDATIAPDILFKDFYDNTGDNGRLYVSFDEDGYWVHMSLYIDGKQVYLNAVGMATLDYADGILTVSSDDLDFSCNGTLIYHDISVDLTVAIDEEFGEYEIVSMPEIDIPDPTALYALEKIGDEANVDESYYFDLDSRITHVEMLNDNVACLYTSDVDSTWYYYIELSYQINDDGSLLCTVESLGVDADHKATDAVTGQGFYGFVYENIELYLDTVQFEIKIIDGTVTVDDLPVFSDEYKKSVA